MVQPCLNIKSPPLSLLPLSFLFFFSPFLPSKLEIIPFSFSWQQPQANQMHTLFGKSMFLLCPSYPALSQVQINSYGDNSKQRLYFVPSARFPKYIALQRHSTFILIVSKFREWSHNVSAGFVFSLSALTSKSKELKAQKSEGSGEWTWNQNLGTTKQIQKALWIGFIIFIFSVLTLLIHVVFTLLLYIQIYISLKFNGAKSGL